MSLLSQSVAACTAGDRSEARIVFVAAGIFAPAGSLPGRAYLSQASGASNQPLIRDAASVVMPRRRGPEVAGGPVTAGTRIPPGGGSDMDQTSLDLEVVEIERRTKGG